VCVCVSRNFGQHSGYPLFDNVLYCVYLKSYDVLYKVYRLCVCYCYRLLLTGRHTKKGQNSTHLFSWNAKIGIT
jgi:hypothetical protein